MLQEKWCLTHFCYHERSQTKDKAYSYGENNCRETAGTLTRTPVSLRQLLDFLNLRTNTLHYCLRYHRFVSVTSNWGAGVKCSVYYNLWSREVSGGFRLLETELRKEPQLLQGWYQHPQSFQKCMVMALVTMENRSIRGQHSLLSSVLKRMYLLHTKKCYPKQRTGWNKNHRTKRMPTNKQIGP